MEYNKDEEELAKIIDEVMKDIKFDPFIEPAGDLCKITSNGYIMYVNDEWIEAFDKAMKEEFDKLNK